MIRFIMAQPAIKYYAWQVEVLLNNMIDIGINLNYVDVVCKIDNEIPDEWDKLRHGYAARFFFYKDQRETKDYISSCILSGDQNPTPTRLLLLESFLLLTSLLPF